MTTTAAVRSDLTSDPLAPYPDLADRIAAAVARPAAQQPDWPDPGRVADVRRALLSAPPVVTAGETERMRERLADVAAGEALLLQCGNCAETFAENTVERLRADLGLLRRLGETLSRTARLPVVRAGRVAGQYGKPRSAPMDALGLPVYRGDIVNAPEPSPAARVPDPERMLLAHAAATGAMNLLRAADEEVFACHEALLLDYERGLLRVDPAPPPRLYGGSGHFLWIGERTRRLDGAHVALAELIANPVGVKLGPATTPEEAVAYAERLDPTRLPGRLTFISRMGAARVREVLPPIVERVTAAGHPVVWMCDPMHGNTRESPSGYKTRHFDDIAEEVRGFVEVHRRLGTHPGGLHLEAAGADVTECLGGAAGLTDADLPARYETTCDPRLNAAQAAELVELAGALWRA
ncbi:MAG TPA: 3-deoxy-7-phosphoheptulonate synthase [Thermomonospora sp.]|nr:3-deoxy-7-phosphoheptulonate synthase [Thermomonospora sp.]